MLTNFDKNKALVNKFLLNFKSKETKKSYHSDISLFILWVENTDLQKITRDDILNYRSFLIKENYKNSTINRKLSSLKSFFGEMFLSGFIKNNPCLRIKMLPRGDINHCSDLTDNEVALFFQEIIKLKKNRSLWVLIFSLFFYSGLRVSEILSLSFGSIKKHGNDWVISVLTKGEKVRVMPLNEEVKTALNIYLEENLKKIPMESFDFPLLFKVVFRNGNDFSLKKVTYREIYYAFKKISFDANIRYKKITPHSSRATVIGHLLDKGFGIEDVADFIGHSDIRTTHMYLRRKRSVENSLVKMIKY